MIAITRPKGEADALTDLLHRRGYRVIHEPLSHVILNHTAQTLLAQALRPDPDAVLVTSRHGVHALAALSDVRDLALLCVGEATAKAAESVGFGRIVATGGTAQQMLEYVLASYDPGSRLVYVSADQVRLDLAQILAKQGFLTQRIVAYDTIAAAHFSDVFTEQLKRRQVSAVTFLSKRTAEIFMALAAQAALQDILADVRAFSVSDAVAEPLLKSGWLGVHVAEKPTLASLVTSIDNSAA